MLIFPNGLDNFGLECQQWDKLVFEQCVELIYLNSVDKGMVTFLFVILMFRALHLLYIVYSQQCFFYFVGKVGPTQCYFRFKL